MIDDMVCNNTGIIMYLSSRFIQIVPLYRLELGIKKTYLTRNILLVLNNLVLNIAFICNDHVAQFLSRTKHVVIFCSCYNYKQFSDLHY